MFFVLQHAVLIKNVDQALSVLINIQFCWISFVFKLTKILSDLKKVESFLLFTKIKNIELLMNPIVSFNIRELTLSARIREYEIRYKNLN